MVLSQELIDSYKNILEDPATHGFSFRPLKECFENAEHATAKHILFNQYIDYLKKPLPKLIFYIIMDSSYRQAKAPDGDLGYKVKFKPAQ